METPIPTGRELKGVRAMLYVAPIRKDVLLPKKLSGDLVKCDECLIEVDSSNLMDHIAVCMPRTDFDSVLNDSVETVVSLNTPFSRQSTSTDNVMNEVAAIEAAVNSLQAFKLSVLDYGTSEENVIEVCRPDYLGAAMAAASSDDFLEKIRRPLRVRYAGEAGIDGGGLRRDYLTHIVNTVESRLNVRHPDDEMHYTAGVFSAIAVMQENITRKYVFDELSNPNFLRGLNELGLGDFLLDNPAVNVLFRDDPVSGDCLLSILRTKTNSDSTADYIERQTFQLLARFIAEVNDGEVFRAPRQRMEVSDILMFATGSKHVCASMDKTIDVRFIFPSANNYPRPSSSTCNEELTLAVTMDYDVFKMSWIEAIASMESGFQCV